MDLSVTVTIGGSDYSDEIVSIDRHHSICETMATGGIELGPNASAPGVYDEVVIYEQGTKVFTGYVTNVNKGRLPIQHSVEIADPAIKLADYWLTETYTCSGESAEFWIEFFCDLAGVSHTFDVSYDRSLPDDYEWEYSSAMSIIEELLLIGGYYMYSDPDGVIHFSKYNTGVGSPLASGDNMTYFSRQVTITASRNQAVVFGDYPIVAVASGTLDELPTGVKKTAVVASPYIETQEHAQELADQMLEHFNKVMDVKTVDIEGDPSYRVGQAVGVTESWSGTSSSSIITTMESRMSNSGYEMTLVLDEMCPRIWGFSQLIRGLYISTAGSGVYFRDMSTLSGTWEPRSGGLTGSGVYVRGMVLHPDDYAILPSGQRLRIATAAGVYYTEDGGYNWTKKTLPNPENNLNDSPAPTVVGLDFIDIVAGAVDTDLIWVLAKQINPPRAFVYRTGDGATWTSRGIAT